MTTPSSLSGFICCPHVAAGEESYTKLYKPGQPPRAWCTKCPPALWVMASVGERKGNLYVEREPNSGLLIGRVLVEDL